jgi:aspartyl protease family protein
MRYLVFLMCIGMMGSILSMPSKRSSSSGAEEAFSSYTSGVDETPTTAEPAKPLDGSIQLQRSPDGHFYADVELNGTTVTMLVDTGATGIALSREDARKAGIATSIGMNEVVGRGADGSVHGEFVTVGRVALGEKSAEQMPATVLNSGEQSLLGQEFLRKFASVEIRADTMTLR